MGACERAAGGGWVVLAVCGLFWAGGWREYAERGKIIWPRGWAVSDFLLSLWHARHNRATLNRPTCPTGTAQGLHRDCTGTAQGGKMASA